MYEQKDLIYVGIIFAACGIKGNIIIKSYSEIPEDILSYNLIGIKNNNQNAGLTIKKIRHKSDNKFVVKINDVYTRNDAEELIGTKLYVLKSELNAEAEGEFYIYKLIGKKLINRDNDNIGIVKNVLNYGAGDIIEIKIDNQKDTILLPFNNDYFRDITEEYVELIKY